MDKKNIENRSISILMQKIDKFVSNYGVNNFINYLDDYQKDIALEEYQKYKNIEKVT